MIKIFFVPVDDAPFVRTVSPDLNVMAQLLGGYPEEVPVDEGLFFYVSEDSAVQEGAAARLVDGYEVSGPFFFARRHAGTFLSLSDRDIAKCRTLVPP